MKRKTTYKAFDAAAYLDNDAVIADYLSAAAEEPNPDVFVAALGDVAKARGMARIAKDSGLGRESLYKALGAGAHPRYETISAVLRALGVKLAVIANPSEPLAPGQRRSRPSSSPHKASRLPAAKRDRRAKRQSTGA